MQYLPYFDFVRVAYVVGGHEFVNRRFVGIGNFGQRISRSHHVDVGRSSGRDAPTGIGCRSRCYILGWSRRYIDDGLDSWTAGAIHRTAAETCQQEQQCCAMMHCQL